MLPLDEFGANVRWQLEGERIAVQASDIHFANADAQGQARVSWHTSDPAPRGARLALSGRAGFVGCAHPGRWHEGAPLPALSIPAESRRYVEQAVVAGWPAMCFGRGDLRPAPSTTPNGATSRIAAKVKDVTYAYVPPSLQPEQSSAALVSAHAARGRADL